MADPEFDKHVVTNAILYDKNGNAIDVILDGSGVYRLAVDSKIRGNSGNAVDVLEDGPVALAIRDEEVVGSLGLIYKELQKIRFLMESGQDIEMGDQEFSEDG